MAIIAYFTSRMTQLIDFVTIVAFISAPILAYINYRTIRLRDLPGEARPPAWLHGLSIAGIAFLACFSGAYVYSRFM